MRSLELTISIIHKNQIISIPACGCQSLLERANRSWCTYAELVRGKKKFADKSHIGYECYGQDKRSDNSGEWMPPERNENIFTR